LNRPSNNWPGCGSFDRGEQKGRLEDALLLSDRVTRMAGPSWQRAGGADGKLMTGDSTKLQMPTALFMLELFHGSVSPDN
jgi:hypothetical protein